MKFGIAENHAKLELGLPKDDPSNAALLNSLGTGGKTKVNIGCPVWGGQYFLGKVYPKGTKSDQFLAEYGKNFNSIELNSMLYRIPKTADIKKWTDAVPKDFIFCPKFPNLITHRKEQAGEDRITAAFLRACGDFKHRLGISFLQMPPYFKPGRLDWMFKYLDSLPKDFKVAVEVRNKEWFEDKTAKNELFDGLAERNITAVITDTPGRRDVIHQRLTTDKLFLRFTGSDGHPTDLKRLDDWVKKILLWESKGIRDINVFMHSPDKSYSPDLVKYMVEKLNQKADFGLKPPSILGDR